MRSILLPVAAALLAAVCMTGCGDDGPTNIRVTANLAEKKIKAAEKSAARSALRDYARGQLLLVEAELKATQGDLGSIEVRMKQAEAEVARLRQNPAEGSISAAQVRLNAIREEHRIASARTGGEAATAKRDLAAWKGLIRKLDVDKGESVYEITEHKVGEITPEAPDRATSTMVLRIKVHQNLLGDKAKAELTWRKVVRKVDSGRPGDSRTNWELGASKVTPAPRTE